MNWIGAIEIFAMVTGVAYVVLEIFQKNAMWVIGILTGIACAFSFAHQQLWASMGLNIYYVVVSVIGLVRWKRDGAEAGTGVIHLRKPSAKGLWTSLAVFVLGSAVLVFVLQLLHDQETALDAIVAVASAVATWWLTLSWKEQWLVWIAADLVSVVLCVKVGMYWMGAMYLVYAGSAIYGYFHWKRFGREISV